MASIENPNNPKHKPLGWFFPVLMLMLIGFPFMQYSFSPLPVLPTDAQIQQVTVTLDGQAVNSTLPIDKLEELLVQAPRERRPHDKGTGEGETMAVSFQVLGEDSTDAQNYQLKFYQDSDDATPTGFLQIDKFFYRLSNPIVLEETLRAMLNGAL